MAVSLGLVRTVAVLTGSGSTADPAPLPLANALTLIGAALLGVTAVVFVAWFTATYRNLSRVGAPRLSEQYGWGWAVVAWVVPIANLIIPAQIAQDMWRATDPDRQQRRSDSPGSLLVGAWWWAFLSSPLIVGITGGVGGRGSARGVLWAAAGPVALAVAAVLAALVVWQLTERYERCRVRVQTSPYRIPTIE